MAEFTTILDGLEVMMRLGIHPHEVAPQRVVVSVEMTVVYPGPLGEDAIEEVLDYDFVRTGIRALTAERPFALQETLCEAIAGLCMGDERVRRVKVRTVKADVYPDARVGCGIVRTR
ncbi:MULTISPECIES: dihydroneopterin aldolase [unclassified Sphingomonas]|uniref:dihydroneopterin aldolase n=1 Tax=unclassified Sphingomonas TaxID=196159 RepID=UPI0006FB3387|nr:MULTISPECIES: dihydroneopterin aldolase [unclassified Sphingomonas]KQS50991.1 dihydroneopterin aldolase [Sphingomonas sp. Leaf198]